MPRCKTIRYDREIRSGASVLVEQLLAAGNGPSLDVVHRLFIEAMAAKYDIPVGIAVLIMGICTGLIVGMLSYYFPW